MINIKKITSEKLGTDKESSDECVSSEGGTGINSPTLPLVIGLRDTLKTEDDTLIRFYNSIT